MIRTRTEMILLDNHGVAEKHPSGYLGRLAGGRRMTQFCYNQQ